MSLSLRIGQRSITIRWYYGYLLFIYNSPNTEHGVSTFALPIIPWEYEAERKLQEQKYERLIIQLEELERKERTERFNNRNTSSTNTGGSDVQ